MPKIEPEPLAPLSVVARGLVCFFLLGALVTFLNQTVELVQRLGWTFQP